MNSFIQSKTPPPRTYRWYHFTGFLFLVALSSCIFLSLQSSQGEVEPLEWKISRGIRHTALRLPVASGYLQEDIVISGSDHVSEPWEVSRGPANVRELSLVDYRIEVITDDQRRELMHLRTEWCAKPPVFHSGSDDMQVYEVVLRCDDGYSHFEHFLIPSNHLPALFREIINAIP
jgi:hypothetical protein